MVEVKREDSPTDLVHREEGVGSGASQTGSLSTPSSLADRESAAAPAAGGQPKQPKPYQFIGRFRSFTKKWGKKKWLIAGIGAGGGVAGITLIAAIIFLISLLSVPGLAANITGYAFARLSREMYTATDRVAEQSIAVEAASSEAVADSATKQSTMGAIDAWFKAQGDRAGNFYGKFERVLPGAAIRNLKMYQGLQINMDSIGFADVKDNPFNAPLLGKQYAKSVTLNGTTYDIPRVSLKPSDLLDMSKFWRNLGKVSGFAQWRNNVSFVRDFAPALKAGLGDRNIGPLVRTLVANRIRSQLGISLIAWIEGSLRGKTPAQAEVALNQQDRQAVIEGEGRVPSAVQELEDASEKAATAGAEDAEHEAAVRTIIDNNGEDPNVTKAINNAVSEGGIKGIVDGVVQLLNPIYTFAVPACIIYEGSLDASKDVINASNTAQVRQFNYTESLADQIRADPNEDWQTHALATGAATEKFGDYSQSIPYLRANGQPIDTSTSAMSTQAGLTTGYTLIDAAGLGQSGIGKAIKNIASGNPKHNPPIPGACTILSNIWFGIGSAIAIQLAELAADFFTEGQATAQGLETEAAIKEATNVAVEAAAKKTVTDRLLSVLANKFTSKTVLAKIRGFFSKRTAVELGVITGMTLLARLYVLSHSGELYNGFEQGNDLANESESGGIIYAGEQARLQGGRAMTCSEQLKTDAADKGFIAERNQLKSFSDRYLSLSSPDSLLSRTAVMLYGQFGSLAQRPLASVANFVSGPLSFSSVAAMIVGHADASVPCANLNYGNVQFGWSMNEEALIDRDSSYLPIPNQLALDQSGRMAEIADKYAKCFGYDYSSGGKSWDPNDADTKLSVDLDGDGSLGSLLSGGDIIRNEAGDVITGKGLCSPQNLGPNNPDYGDMVFRFRLFLRYIWSINQLLDYQTITQ